MPFVVPNVGEVAILANLRTNFLNSFNLRLDLYQNDYTPDADSVLADFTVGTYDGYAQESIGTFALVTSVGGRAFTSQGPIVFLCTGGGVPNNIYGYLVSDLVSGEVVWAERLPGAPFAMDSAGKTVTITPSFTLSSES